MREFVGRIHFQSIAKLFDGSVVLPRHVEPPSYAEVDADGEWIEFAGFVDLRDAVSRAIHRNQIKRVSLVGGRITWIVVNGFGESRGGAIPIPIVVKLDGGERRFGFRECGIDLECL